MLWTFGFAVPMSITATRRGILGRSAVAARIASRVAAAVGDGAITMSVACGGSAPAVSVDAKSEVAKITNALALAHPRTVASLKVEATKMRVRGCHLNARG